jgi:hypothetical protein
MPSLAMANFPGMKLLWVSKDQPKQRRSEVEVEVEPWLIGDFDRQSHVISILNLG